MVTADGVILVDGLGEDHERVPNEEMCNVFRQERVNAYSHQKLCEA